MSGFRNSTYSDGNRRTSSLCALQKPVFTGERVRYSISKGSMIFKVSSARSIVKDVNSEIIERLAQEGSQGTQRYRGRY